MEPLSIKNDKELKIMAEGGHKLGEIMEKLRLKVKEGVSAAEIEKEAESLIEKSGGKASFKMVPGYHWATCVNVNEGLVHGIPSKDVVFKKGDVVSVDAGLFYRRFHTDASFSLGIKVDKKIKKFLDTGEKALKDAIGKATLGNKISDISKAIQADIESQDFSPIRALVGHGVGKALHEEPAIPCLVTGRKDMSLQKGMVLAIEVMYTLGSPEVYLGKDGWTISTRDGKISALFEKTVAVTAHGPLVLTT